MHRATDGKRLLIRRLVPSYRAKTHSGPMRGGTEGNERLTVVTGALLIVLLAAVGVTIAFIGQLLWLHLFLGLVVIGPVALKVVSTGYRFVRYYTADPPYRRKGPPAPVLRALGPVLVTLTAIVLATGVALLLIGPSSRGTLVLVHKVSFICWAVVTAVHIAGHLPEMVRFNRGGSIPGRGARWLSVATALAFGFVVAAVLIPDFAAWTRAQPLFHHHHHFH
jgi:hypothetical protein